jgi:hypothetical protein
MYREPLPDTLLDQAIFDKSIKFIFFNKTQMENVFH